jgi:hypothetical protein
MPSDDRHDRATSHRRSTDESLAAAPHSDADDDLRAVVRDEVRAVVREEFARVGRNALALLAGGVLGFAGFAALATGLTASGYGGVAVVAAVLALAAGAALLLSTGWRLLRPSEG